MEDPILEVKTFLLDDFVDSNKRKQFVVVKTVQTCQMDAWQ